MKNILNRIPFGLKLTTSFIYIGIIVALSLLPVKDLPKIPLFPGADKLIHTTMYFILAVLLLWAFHNKKITRWKLYSFVIAWGLLMEITQVLMHLGRSFSLLDILANICGAFLGIISYKFLVAKKLL